MILDLANSEMSWLFLLPNVKFTLKHKINYIAIALLTKRCYIYISIKTKRL